MSSKSKQGPKKTARTERAGGAPRPSFPPGVSRRSRLAALLFCCFAGFMGAHRYYAKRYFTGLLMTITIGFAFIGVIYDLVKIIRGTFKDNRRLPLLLWRTPGDRLAVLLSLFSVMVFLKMSPLLMQMGAGLAAQIGITDRVRWSAPVEQTAPGLPAPPLLPETPAPTAVP